VTRHDELEKIPGTYVMTPERSRMGYPLNMFCKTLDVAENRAAFRADPSGYLDRFPLTAEQRHAVETRDWLGMLRLGGSVYYTFKVATFDGLSMQGMGGLMSGVSEAEFRQMMINGGRRKGDPNT
jgi:protocatechuate 4,5-dioxygenase alpha chain